MDRPLFFTKDGVFYNVNQILKFEIKGTTYNITMISGELVQINTGHLKLHEVINVANPPYGEKYNTPEAR